MKKKKENKNSFIKYFIVIILGIIIGAGAMFCLLKYFKSEQTIINRSEKKVTITDNGIADSVDKLYDSVVVVEVFQNDLLAASGTGFVYQKTGNKAYILTNNHVVASSKSVKVMFTDKTEVEAKIEGKDEYSDLAVLSVEANDKIKVADIGDNTKMRLGDTVFTIGAPLDTSYYWTVTRGVLSGKDRMVEVSSSQSKSQSAADYVMRVLQTDASINSGNSGGPLANANGEVIGITNMKLVSDGVEGIGFAIPIEDAVEFAKIILSGDQIKRPLLGIRMLDLTSKYELYQQGITLNTELKEGVVVVEVQDGSPADKAGLKRGDIITKLDEEEIKNLAVLRYHLYKHKVGDTVTISYERAGKIETTKVKLTVANQNDN